MGGGKKEITSFGGRTFKFHRLVKRAAGSVHHRCDLRQQLFGKAGSDRGDLE